jgi:hypothetical protein
LGSSISKNDTLKSIICGIKNVFCRSKTFYNYLILFKVLANVNQNSISIFIFEIIPIKVLKKTLNYMFFLKFIPYVYSKTTSITNSHNLITNDLQQNKIRNKINFIADFHKSSLQK